MRKHVTLTALRAPITHDNRIFDVFNSRLQARVDEALASGQPIFQTDAGEANDLPETFIVNLPDNEQQHHRCHCCCHFIERYASLATVTEDGTLEPLIWGSTHNLGIYADSIEVLGELVQAAKITGVFYGSDATLGTPKAGGWTHLNIKLPTKYIHTDRTRTPFQKSAEKLEDLKNIKRALQEFKKKDLEMAVKILSIEDALYRSEKVLGAAEWLLKMAKIKNENLLWREVAIAPPGFCHPRSSMIGTLLEDISAGMAFEMIKTRFADKMHPLQYQRPTAAPKSGTIDQAEKLVEQLGIARSLERRFAYLSDLDTLWTPKPKRMNRAGGVFSALRQPEAEMAIGSKTMTWVKFLATVLPVAESIELLVKRGRDSYITMTTAVHADAPPILQWDREVRRNPVAWYIYSCGSEASQFNLTPGTWAKVTGITLQPSLWGDQPLIHHGEAVSFILAGCVDKHSSSLGLFPECMRSELHAVRSVIEKYSRTGTLAGRNDASACGVRLQKGAATSVRLRVHADGVSSEYTIDRWD